MVVLLVQSVKPSLRGEITRWMLEVQPGVFVGTMSAMVRDRLWAKVIRAVGDGGALRIYSSNTEQGFALEQYGKTRYQLEDFDGLVLVKRPETE